MRCLVRDLCLIRALVAHDIIKNTAWRLSEKINWDHINSRMSFSPECSSMCLLMHIIKLDSQELNLKTSSAFYGSKVAFPCTSVGLSTGRVKGKSSPSLGPHKIIYEYECMFGQKPYICNFIDLWILPFTDILRLRYWHRQDIIFIHGKRLFVAMII